MFVFVSFIFLDVLAVSTGLGEYSPEVLMKFQDAGTKNQLWGDSFCFVELFVVVVGYPRIPNTG